VSSESGFNSHWHSCESLVVAESTSRQNYSHVLVKSPALAGMTQPLTKGVNDVKFGCKTLTKSVPYFCQNFATQISHL